MFCEKCGDQVEQNETYCNKCGNFLGNRSVNNAPKPSNSNNYNNNNMFGNNVRNLNQQMMNMNYSSYSSQQNNYNYYNNQNFNEPTNSNSKLRSLAVGFVYGAIALIFAGFYVMSTMGPDIYFSGDAYKDKEEVKEQDKNRKTKTVIISDNKYTGVTINNSNDAYKLIEKDSVEQKNSCPEEIINVEKSIIKDFNITAVNLCEMETGFAKEVSKVFKKIYDEYPVARGYLTNLTLVNAPMSSSYIAAFQPIFTFATSATESTYPWVLKTQIYLNTSYFLNKERLEISVESGSETGHFPKNATIYSPVAHELGHYLSFLAMMNNYNVDSILIIKENQTDMLYKLMNDFSSGVYSLVMIKEAYENYRREVGTSLTLDDWRATISSYAVAKDNSGKYIYDETIAEAFHDIYLNGNKAAPASKYIVNVLKSKLKKVV